MLLPIKPICPFEKTRQNGTSIIFLQYCQNSDRKTLLNTEIAIPPKFWNRKINRVMDDLPAEYGTAKSISLEIHRLFRMAEDIKKFAIRLGNLDPVNFVKQTFSPDFDNNLLGIRKPRIEVKIEPKKIEKVNIDFFFQFDQYLKSKESMVSRGTMHRHSFEFGVGC
jgi:Arm DNA-binding domain